MTAYSGQDGCVKISTNFVVEVTAWDLTSTGELLETTAMRATGGNRTYLPGLNSHTGSITCHWDPTDTNGQEALDIGATVSVSLQPRGDTTGMQRITASVYITEINWTVELEAITQRSFSFTVNGGLTFGTVS